MNRLLRQFRLFRDLGLPQHPPPAARTPVPPAVAPADLGDTSRCPPGKWCKCCDRERDDLAVRVFDVGSVGVACLSMCPTCAESTVSLRVGIGTAVTLVLQHTEHVGADVDAEELLRRRYYHDDGGVIGRPRPAPADPRCTSSTEGER